MDFTGSQKIKASRQAVFQALLTPEVIKNSVPGCDGAEFVDFPSGRQLKLTITPNIPGIGGSHDIFLQTGEIIPDSRVVLISEPSSSLGTIKARCTVDLTDDAEGTLLTYNAHVDREGKVAAIPELMVKGAVKVALDQFFKNFEKQASSIPA
jgi:carbon monoxide dehydrogenase subunit G